MINQVHNSFLFFSFLSLFSLCLGGNTYVTVSNCPPVGSHIPFSGRLCMPAPSVCFWTPRLSLGHPGSFTSVHELKCMRTQTAPLFNVPRGRRGTTTRVVHPYPHGTSRAGNRTRVVVGGVQSANHYTMGLAVVSALICFIFIY